MGYTCTVYARYGRKPVLLACTAVNSVCGIVAALSVNIWMYSVVRFFIGFSQAAQFNAAYILCAVFWLPYSLFILPVSCRLSTAKVK